MAEIIQNDISHDTETKMTSRANKYFTVYGPDGERIAIFKTFDSASEFVRSKMDAEMKRPSDGDTVEWIFRNGKIYTIVTLKRD
jgi:hypothetical protein